MVEGFFDLGGEGKRFFQIQEEMQTKNFRVGW